MDGPEKTPNARTHPYQSAWQKGSSSPGLFNTISDSGSEAAETPRERAATNQCTDTTKVDVARPPISIFTEVYDSGASNSDRSVETLAPKSSSASHPMVFSSEALPKRASLCIEPEADKIPMTTRASSQSRKLCSRAPQRDKPMERKLFHRVGGQEETGISSVESMTVRIQ